MAVAPCVLNAQPSLPCASGTRLLPSHSAVASDRPLLLQRTQRTTAKVLKGRCLILQRKIRD